ncbi:hypothetical protein JOB18_027207 [Solea senegalensis]|uniref:Reverse transcriptase domain-containing protein n=1 Tax=Solea senegalensis TaxID=28829 RepID=A0AAV6PXA6_SOLSE|nr:hypothetical protein JOB18_027207 [Solea senegalensis]
MKSKRQTIRSSTTKLLTRIDEEVSKEQPECEKLHEMLSVLSTKEEQLVDLNKGIEDETLTDELEAEVASMLDYQDHIITLKTRTKRLIERSRETVSAWPHAFWEVESLDIVNEPAESPEEAEALQNFEQTTTFKDGCYQVALPWRWDRSALLDNFRVAKKQLESLKRKLKTDAALYTRYNDVIKDYIEQGMCEDAPNDVPAAEHPETVKYHMPHHAVLREDKVTTKLRVFDASSHEGCPSLNDSLLTGPNLNPNLLDVLIQFRLHPIAFTADITKAFLQIALAEKDKDAVRFLWLHGPPTKGCENELHILRMNRVVFGVSPSPFLLAATIRKHIKMYEIEQPKTVQALRESLYVDDFISSSANVNEAFSVTTTAKEIMSHAGLDLCKWVTNSPELRAKWIEN